MVPTDLSFPTMGGIFSAPPWTALDGSVLPSGGSPSTVGSAGPSRHSGSSPGAASEADEFEGAHNVQEHVRPPQPRGGPVETNDAQELVWASPTPLSDVEWGEPSGTDSPLVATASPNFTQDPGGLAGLSWQCSESP